MNKFVYHLLLNPQSKYKLAINVSSVKYCVKNIKTVITTKIDYETIERINYFSVVI